MNKNDVVRIFRQPENQWAPLEGLVGFVSEIRSGGAEITAISISGRGVGSGWVALDCLKPETAPEWIDAKRLYDAYMADLEEHCNHRTKKWQMEAEKVAAEHGLTTKTVLAVYDAMESFRYDMTPA